MKNQEQKGTRLNQYIASCGICSRREADRLIEAGRVSVDGAPASTGMRVLGSETVTVDGKPVAGRQKRIVVAFYKPLGVTCTEKDPHAERTLKEAFSYPVRLTYAGRLDKDSEGLLLMTNDGELIDSMMRGSAGHEKEYIVRVKKKISDADPSVQSGTARRSYFPDHPDTGAEPADPQNVQGCGERSQKTEARPRIERRARTDEARGAESSDRERTGRTVQDCRLQNEMTGSQRGRRPRWK